MAKEYQGCSNCDHKTYWIVKGNGVKCTGCQVTVTASGPFQWRYEGCSTCGHKTYWIYDVNEFQVCTKCGTGGEARYRNDNSGKSLGIGV